MIRRKSCTFSPSPAVSPALYPHIHGTTDSEIMFFLALTFGISVGQSLYAIRYSTEGKSRSLYHSIDMAALHEIAPQSERFSDDTRAVVSEPLGDLAEAWTLVPESSFLTVAGGEVRCEPFEPEPVSGS